MLLTAYHLGVLDINANSTFSQHDVNAYLHNVVSPVSLTTLEPEQAVYLRHAVLMHLLASTKYRPNIIKTHCANIQVGGVELIPGPMSAGAVYVVRDPRDVVVSFARHIGASVDVTIGNMATAENRLQNQGTAVASWLQTWSNHVKSWDIPGCTRIRYEDMKEDPYGEFVKILEGFRMTLDEDKARKAVELCELDRLKKQEEEKGMFIEKGKHDKFFGQGKGWKNELTEAQVKKLELDHGEVMESLGYKLEYL
jgi:hypothetical protein